MSPTIRIDNEVLDKLKEHAEPFVDTPNSVLRRILELRAAALKTTEVDDGAAASAGAAAAQDNGSLHARARRRPGGGGAASLAQEREQLCRTASTRPRS